MRGVNHCTDQGASDGAEDGGARIGAPGDLRGNSEENTRKQQKTQKTTTIKGITQAKIYKQCGVVEGVGWE